MNSIGDEVKKLYRKDLVENNDKKKKKGKTRPRRRYYLMGALVILIIVHIIILIYYYNKFATMQQYIKAQQSQIEKEYQRRVDLIPNLINIALDYAQHERELFHYVSNARSLMEAVKKFDGSMNSMKSSNIEKTLSGLIALAEQYPDLKATQSFQDLMNMVEVTENRLATMRENYITLIRDYNTLMVTFPSNIFNSFFGFELFDYYRFDNSFVPEINKIKQADIEEIEKYLPKKLQKKLKNELQKVE